jgi:hypothetical protein
LFLLFHFLLIILPRKISQWRVHQKQGQCQKVFQQPKGTLKQVFRWEIAQTPHKWLAVSQKAA